jgi:hypothetical protein
VWVPDVANGSSGTLVVLPSWNGAVKHRAEGINDAGDVVGWGVNARGITYALLWRRNPSQTNKAAPDYYLAPVDLGAALGRSGKAYDINNALKVVGQLKSDAFVWDPVHGVRLLPSPPGGSAAAVRLNESEPTTAAGQASVSGNWHAIRWTLP